MLSNGHGGVDWSGLDLAIERFEIEDVDAFIERLIVIKNHQPPEDSLNEEAPGAQ